MTKPVTPEEITARKAEIIPSVVYDVFNQLIAEKWDGHKSEILTIEAKKLILARMPSLEDSTMNYLDVEDVYRAAGWRVTYSKPDYTESFQPYFTFSKGKRT